MSIISIYITHPNKKHAHRITSMLLSEKLVACNNTFKSRSSYVWKDKLKNENEYISISKTSAAMWEQICKRVTEEHEYVLPSIVRFDIEANPAYTEWVLSLVDQKSK